MLIRKSWQKQTNKTKEKLMKITTTLNATIGERAEISWEEFNLSLIHI